MKTLSSATVMLLSWVVLCSPALALADMTFKASDGESVHATLTQASPATHNSSPSDTSRHGAVALLFHQARGNRHEYDAIAPRLNAMGYDTLAVDQRSGGSLFEHRNATVRARGKSTDYLPAYADLKGAVDWAQAQHYKAIVAVGSSYSASLVLRLAKLDGNALTAVAVFSPGEYFDDTQLIRHAVGDIRIPIYITTDPAEEEHVDTVLQDADNAMVTRYKPVHGVHGASTLDPSRDAAGAQANWASFADFMARYAPDTDTRLD